MPEGTGIEELDDEDLEVLDEDELELLDDELELLEEELEPEEEGEVDVEAEGTLMAERTEG